MMLHMESKITLNYTQLLLAERSEPLVQCIFFKDSLLSLHFFKASWICTVSSPVFKTMPRCPHGDNRVYSLYNKLPCWL